MQAATDPALVARVEQLRGEVRQQKKDIRQRQDRLRTTAAALAALERELAQRGIKLVVVPARSGVEVTHGPDRSGS